MHALSATELYTLSLHDALPIWRREDHRGAVIKTDPALRQGADLQRSARHHAAADPALLRALQGPRTGKMRSEEHTSELQSHSDLVCRLLLEKKNHRSTPFTGGR